MATPSRLAKPGSITQHALWCPVGRDRYSTLHILFTSTEEYTLTAVVSENDGCRALGDPAMVILSSCPLNRSPAHQTPSRSYRALHQQTQTISRRAEVHEIPRVPASIFRTRLLLVPLTVRLPPTHPPLAPLSTPESDTLLLRVK